MVTRSFSIFNGDSEQLAQNGDNLVMEVGKSHLALLLTRSESAAIAAFELFTFTEKEASPDKLFTAISNTSSLLKQSYSGVKVYSNNEVCLPVPSAKFTESTADDYLTLMFGEDVAAAIHYDELVQPEIVNLYRVPNDLKDVLNDRFSNVAWKHSWSNVLTIMKQKGLLSAGDLVHVQFYNTYFIAAVVKNGMLQLIQIFIYENPEDVLYQLLNVCRQLGLSTTEVEISVSGLIDPNYKLFRELSNYFKNITAAKADLDNVLINVSEYPRHYFTPFFNLAL